MCEKSRLGFMPLTDIGFVYVFFICLYSLIPMFSIYFANADFGILSPKQLRESNIALDEFTNISMRYLIYLLGFMLGYKIFGHLPIIKSSPLKGKLILQTTWILYFLIFIYDFSFQSITGVEISPSYTRVYENADLYSSLPHHIKQIHEIIIGVGYIAKLGLIVSIYSGMFNKFWTRLAIVLVCYELITSISVFGSRTEIAFIMFSLVLTRQIFVKRSGTLKLTIALIIAFMLFFVFGITRGNDISQFFDVISNISAASSTHPLLIDNEFLTLFAGTFEAIKLYETVPIINFFHDVLLLIPQQILPFSKFDPQLWYVENAPIGGFFIMNPIVQGSWGFGVVGIFIRGLVCGVTLFWFANYLVRRTHRAFYLMSYIFSIVFIYYSFRSNSFYFVYLFMYRLLPFGVVILIIRSLAPRKMS